MSNDNDGGAYTRGFVFGALIGGAIGAITALLLAPKSGAELRQELAEKSAGIYDKASDYFDDVHENVGTAVSTTVNEGRIRAESIINKAKAQAEELLESAEDVLKEARTKASSAKEQVQAKIENVKDAAKASAEAFKAEIGSKSEDEEEEV